MKHISSSFVATLMALIIGVVGCLPQRSAAIGFIQPNDGIIDTDLAAAPSTDDWRPGEQTPLSQAYMVTPNTDPLTAPVAHVTAKITITSLTLKSGRHIVHPQGQNVLMEPFPNYHGKVWGKKISYADGAKSLYLFTTLNTSNKGALKLYDHAGNLIQVIKPFGTFSPGYNVTIMVNPNDNSAYLAIAPKKWGGIASVFLIQDGHLQYIDGLDVTAGGDTGDALVKFLPLYPQRLGLVTMIADQPDSLTVWHYSSVDNTFIVDENFDLNRLEVNGRTISLIKK